MAWAGLGKAGAKPGVGGLQGGRGPTQGKNLPGWDWGRAWPLVGVVGGEGPTGRSPETWKRQTAEPTSLETLHS